MKPVIEIRNLVKSFGKFQALKGVSLDVYPGEVHALLGDNGAGKSTLIRILSGFFRQTAGRFRVDGREAHFRSPRDATESGVGTVYQELALNTLPTVSRTFF